jgi:hypothetical protein
MILLQLPSIRKSMFTQSLFFAGTFQHCTHNSRYTALLNECNKVTAELNAGKQAFTSAERHYNLLAMERDQLVTERDQLVTGRDQLATECAQLRHTTDQLSARLRDSAASSGRSAGRPTDDVMVGPFGVWGEPPAGAVFLVTDCKNERVDGFYREADTDGVTRAPVFTKIDESDDCVIEFRFCWMDDKKRWRVHKKSPRDLETELILR